MGCLCFQLLQDIFQLYEHRFACLFKNKINKNKNKAWFINNGVGSREKRLNKIKKITAKRKIEKKKKGKE